MKSSLFVFLAAFLFIQFRTYAELAQQGQFKISPIAQSRMSEQDLTNNIKQVMSDSTESEIQQAQQQALNYKKQITETLQTVAGKSQSFEIQNENFYGAGTMHRFDVSFDSLFQRPNDHKSNKVRGIYIGPQDLRHCGYAYPTVLFVHHLQDDIDPEIQVSEFLAGKYIINKAVAVMIIFLPHYGPRRNSESETFVNPDLQAFKVNAVQSILDIHLMRDFLSQQSYVDQKRISLFGISLGAMLSLTAAGMDPGFTGGVSIMAGGGHIAKMFDTFFSAVPDDELSRPFLRMGWDLKKATQIMAPLDPLTWAAGLRDQRIQFVVFESDILVPYKTSIMPITQQISSQNPPEIVMLEGNHRPQASSLLDKLILAKNILWPLNKFVDNDSSIHSNQLCPGEQANY